MQVRNKFSPNLPKVQCRRMPIAVENCRFIKKDDKTGVVTVSGYAVKWDSVNYYGEKFIKGAFADVCAAFNAGTKKSSLLLQSWLAAMVCRFDYHYANRQDN